MTFETKDSGARAEYDSGMVRDVEEGKPRFDLLLPLGVPYAEQMLTRDAMLMERGRKKYGARNWENANGEAELARYHSSAHRHLMQWIAGETDEDHAAAVRFNIMAGEFVKRKLAATPIAIEHGCHDNPLPHVPVKLDCGHTCGDAPAPDCSGSGDVLLTKFLCGHWYGDAPITTRDAGPLCGTSVHWSRTEGIFER